MNQKDDALLPLPPLQSDIGFSTDGNFSVEPMMLTGQDVESILFERDRQTTAIDATTIVALYGLSKMGAVQVAINKAFHKIVDQAIDDIKGERDRDKRAYVEIFGKRLIEETSMHYFTLLRVTGYRVLEEIYRSPHPLPAPEPETIGWLKRLFG